MWGYTETADREKIQKHPVCNESEQMTAAVGIGFSSAVGVCLHLLVETVFGSRSRQFSRSVSTCDHW